LGEKRIVDLSLKQEELGGENRINNSLGLSSEKFNELLGNSGVRGKLESLSKQGQQYLGEAKTKIYEVAKTKEFNQIADATPFVGGAKRVAESVYGKTLSGEDLSGKDRLMHGAKGAVDLGLDFTGVGEVEKGAKLAYVGKKIATGLKDNPEAVANLGKKIIQKNETPSGDKDANTEMNFSKPFSLRDATQEAAEEQAKKPEKKTIEKEVEDFNKWQAEQKERTKSPDENRAEIIRRTLKGENVGNIIKDLSKNNLRMENESSANFQKPSERFGEVANKGKKEESPYESSIGYAHTFPLDVESILSKKPEKTDLNFEGSKEKWTGEEKQEAETGQENLRYREKITNPETLKIIDENSEKVRQELKEVEKNIGDKLLVRDEKIKAKKDEIENFLKGRDETLKEKKFLEEEIPRQEAYVNGIIEDIREREKKIQELESQGALGKFKNRDQIEKLKNEANGLAEYSYKKEKDKLGEYANKLAETNNKLENDFSLKKASSQMEKVYDEWQKSLSYGGMTEANPEYLEKLEVATKKQLEFYEKNNLKREGLDKDSLRSDFSSVAGKLIYGAESDKSFYPIRNEKTEDMPSMEASAYAIGMKNEDVEEFLRAQEKLKLILAEDEMLDKKDFDTARHRAYYEARRTGRNIFSHVTNSEYAEKILQSGVLTGARKNNSESTSRDHTDAFFASGGGGYNNYWKRKIGDKGESFAFFVASGNDILSAEKSVEVATPGLKEKNEYASGVRGGDFEAEQSEIPIDKFFLVIPESQKNHYNNIMKENGRNPEKIITIPEDIMKKAVGESGMMNDAIIQEFVDSEIRKKVIQESDKEKIYATVAGKNAADHPNAKKREIFKWQALN